MGILSLFLMQLKLILYYLLGSYPVASGKGVKDLDGIVRVLKVKEMIKSITSKGDQRVC